MSLTRDAVRDEGFLAITSLSRALGGGVPLPDVGSLLWVILGQIVPCHAMALLSLDVRRKQVVVRYAAGAHAGRLLGVRRPAGPSIAAWVAVNRRSVLNAEPMFDLGRVSEPPPLRSSVVVPLIDNGAVIAVLALYSKDLLAFTDEHASLLELLGPRLALSLADAALPQIDPAVEPRPALRLVPRT